MTAHDTNHRLQAARPNADSHRRRPAAGMAIPAAVASPGTGVLAIGGADAGPKPHPSGTNDGTAGPPPRPGSASGPAARIFERPSLKPLACLLAAVALLSFGAATARAAGEDEALGSVREQIAESLPGLTATRITETPVAGLFELIANGQIYYVNESVDYLLDGSLIELETRTNITEGRLGGIQTSLIEEIGEENMLIYEPEEPTERSITVFTDISCGYCRRLHQDLDGLLDAGVRVRYLLYPRAGLGSQVHKDLESVWCAEDPLAAMTAAKAGARIAPATCDNPIESHVALAEQVGLRGTPLIYLDTGTRIPGYHEPSALAEMVNASEPLGN